METGPWFKVSSKRLEKRGSILRSLDWQSCVLSTSPPPTLLAFRKILVKVTGGLKYCNSSLGPHVNLVMECIGKAEEGGHLYFVEKKFFSLNYGSPALFDVGIQNSI